LIRHDPLQPPVLVFQLLQAPGLRSIQPSVLLPPPIERCLRDPLASSNLCDLGTGVRFLQDADDLLVGESTLSHGLLRLGNPIITGSGSGGHLTVNTLPAMVPCDLFFTQAKEAGGVVIKDVSLLVRAEERGFSDYGNGPLDHPRSDHLVR
jgi:hypothetical protein